MNGYRAQEFARLSGVTIRALHHYDRIGLLKPERTCAGYRLYRDADFERLEQIVALKFIGVPLQQIERLLGADAPELPKALRFQRRLLEEKRRLLDRAIAAIRKAEHALITDTSPGSSVLKEIIEVIAMQTNSDWMLKYFDEDAKVKVEERKKSWTPELQAQTEQDWSNLFRDIQGALHEDPASPKAQDLLERWNNLARALLGGDPQLPRGVKALFADRANWPADFAERMAPFSDDRVWDFIRKTASAR